MMMWWWPFTTQHSLFYLLIWKAYECMFTFHVYIYISRNHSDYFHANSLTLSVSLSLIYGNSSEWIVSTQEIEWSASHACVCGGELAFLSSLLFSSLFVEYVKTSRDIFYYSLTKQSDPPMLSIGLGMDLEKWLCSEQLPSSSLDFTCLCPCVCVRSGLYTSLLRVLCLYMIETTHKGDVEDMHALYGSTYISMCLVYVRTYSAQVICVVNRNTHRCG